MTKRKTKIKTKNKSCYSFDTAKAWTWSLVLIVLFLICLFWGTILNDPELASLHLKLMKIYYPGFTGINIGSIFLGILESIIYGWVLTAIIIVAKSIVCCQKK